jgi:uncharacterized protein VirK/YbjX
MRNDEWGHGGNIRHSSLVIPHSSFIIRHSFMEEQFKRINDKLQRLLRQYQLLQKDNERLNQSLKNHIDKSAQQQQQIEALTQQVLVLKSAAGQMEESDKKAFEKRINRYIKSIDKYITYLSD